VEVNILQPKSKDRKIRLDQVNQEIQKTDGGLSGFQLGLAMAKKILGVVTKECQRNLPIEIYMQLSGNLSSAKNSINQKSQEKKKGKRGH